VVLNLSGNEPTRTPIQFDPANSTAWIKFAELETTLGDLDRTRAIFELAISQAALDMPELLWKAYIDFEFEEGERERTRALYERLLEKSRHVKIWIAYALFEAAKIGGDEEEDGDVAEDAKGDPDMARKVFERGYKDIKESGEKDEKKWVRSP
jgi:crooked neck